MKSLVTNPVTLKSHKQLLSCLLGMLLAVLEPAFHALAQPCRSAACEIHIPANAGAINVRDYGAKGDGHTDDTAALKAAIAASGSDTGVKMWHDRMVFLPKGTYIVSDTLVKRYSDGLFASGMSLVGEGVDRTIVRLIDHAPGFDNAGSPRAVIQTTSKRLDKANNRDYVHLGEGNDAYENFVESLTVEVGRGNPGAIGIDYLASNIGALRDIVIKAPSGGAIGLAMLRKWPGPALVQRVTVQGFDVGIDVSQSEYGLTFSKVSLEGQRLLGLRNTGNSIAAEDLTINGAGKTAIENQSSDGLIVLVGGQVVGGGVGSVENRGTIVFHGTHLPPGAFPSAPKGARLDGWVSRDGTWTPEAPISLPPLSPMVDPGPASKWVGVNGVPDGAPPTDCTPQLQAALNSGASTVLLRHGTFWISAPLEIPPQVHRIMGMNSSIQVMPKRQSGFSNSMGMFRILAAGVPLNINHLALDNSDRGYQLGIEMSANRSLLLSDIVSIGVDTLERKAGGGPVFLEDTCCGTLHVAGSEPAVARQFNTEGGGVRVRNVGAPLEIIGLKTEQNCTVVVTSAGGRTEVLGGLIYMVVTPTAANRKPVFISEDSSLIVSLVEEVQRPASHYDTLLVDTHGGQTSQVEEATMPTRSLGKLVPLLSAGISAIAR